MKPRPILSVIVAGVLFSLVYLPTPGLSQDIPRADLGKIIDYAQLSEAVYADRHAPPLPEGWKLLERDATLSGLQWGLYERQGPNGTRERVLAFAGTQDLKDWLTNADQALRKGIPGTGISIPSVAIPADQYQEALQVAMRFVEAKDKDAKMSLAIIGHSLGGALAQYVALKTGLKAVLFNAAALGTETVRDIAAPLLAAASRQITHITMRDDPVHNLTRAVLGGKHFGVEYEVEPMPGTAGIAPLDAPLLTSLSVKEWTADKLARHSMQNLGASLLYEKAYGDIQRTMRARAAEATDMAQVANWWTVATAKKSAGQLLAEARIMTEMAHSAKRVVVAGEGPAADLMEQRMTVQLGAENVVRLAGAADSERAQRQAHQCGADLILGVRPSPSRSPVNPDTEERIAELREPLENVVAIVKSTAGALRQFDLAAKTNNNVAQWFVSPGNERLQNVLGHADTVYGFVKALEQDMGATSREEFTLVRSYVLEETARVGVDYLLPQLQESLRRYGGSRLVVPTFGAVDGVTAVARHVGSGSVDLETLTLYLDAVNSAAWGALGLVGSAGNLKVAEVSQSFGSTVAKVVRDTSKGWFARTWAQIHGQPLLLEASWRTLQENNVHHNRQVQTIEQMFGKELLDQSGFSRTDLARLNADAAHYERLRLALPRLASQPVQQNLPIAAKAPSSASVPDVGGIWGQVKVDNNAFGRSEGGQR